MWFVRASCLTITSSQGPIETCVHTSHSWVDSSMNIHSRISGSDTKSVVRSSEVRKEKKSLKFSIKSLLFWVIMLSIFTTLSLLISWTASKDGYCFYFIVEESEGLGKRSKITQSSLLPGPGFKFRFVISQLPCFLKHSRSQGEWATGIVGIYFFHLDGKPPTLCVARSFSHFFLSPWRRMS